VLNDEPQNLPGAMMETAISQHEMYLSWVEAGFTPEQALELLKVIISEIVRGGA
jgi:hypothetical protein